MESQIEEKRKNFKLAIQHTFDESKLREITDTEEFDQYVRQQLDQLQACKRRLKPAPDMLGVQRHSCSQCITLCQAYQPFEVFVLEVHQRTYADTFVPSLCRNCKCPAYFHQPIVKPLNFPKELKQGLRHFNLRQENLNFQGTVAIFDIDYRKLQGEIHTLKSAEDDLFLILQHGGFRVISRTIKVLTKKEELNFRKKQRMETSTAQMLYGMAKTAISSIKSSHQSTIPQLLKQKLSHPCLILCLSATNYVNSQVQFNKFMQAVKEIVPNGLQYLYGSQNSTKGLTDCTQFFPQIFSVKHMCVLLMPEHNKLRDQAAQDPIMAFFRVQSEKIRGKKVTDRTKDPNKMSEGRLRDMLNYNGYSVQSNTLKDVKDQNQLIRVFDTVLEQDRSVHFLKLLLGSTKDYQIQAIGAAKVGMPLILTVNPFSLETFAFNSEKDCRALFDYFLPSLSHNSRTLLLFRPLAVRSGLNQILIDIFKCNHFIIVQSVFRKLTVAEAKMFLDTQFTEAGLAEYLDFMLETECQILVLTKIGAIEDARVVCNGAQFGRRRTQKQLLGARNLIIRKQKEFHNPFHRLPDSQQGREVYREPRFIQENVRTFHNMGENHLFTLNPFSSINEMLDVDSIIVNSIKDLQMQLDTPNLHSRQKELEKYRQFSRHYNIGVYSSSDREQAQKQITYFFPHLQDYSDVILIYKPEAFPIKTEVLVLISQLNASVIGNYRSADSEYLHVSALAARYDFPASMNQSALVSHPLSQQHLSSLFELIDIPAEYQRVLEQVAPDLAYFTGEQLVQVPEEIRNQILRYIILTNTNEELEPQSISLLYSSHDFANVSFNLCTQKESKVEVRVRRLGSLERKDSVEDRLSLINGYQGVKFYYREVAKYFPNAVPSKYSYKLEPDDIDLDLSRVFATQSFKGDLFINVASQMMKENREREQSKASFRNMTQDPRGSMAAFMWGRKLALFVQNLEKVKSSLQDCGVLYRNSEGKLKGCIEDSQFWEVERFKYYKCLDQLKSGWTQYLSPEKPDKIQKHLLQILESPAFQQARALSNVSLIPEFLDIVNLRVFQRQVQAGQLANKITHSDMTKRRLAELRGQDKQLVEVKQLAIVDVLPYKSHFRHLAANILWLLKVRMGKTHRKFRSLHQSQDQYDVMTNSIYEGFLNNYKQDAGIKGISMLKLQHFLFSFWQTWKTHLAMQEVKYRRTDLLRAREDTLRNKPSNVREVIEMFNLELDALQIEFQKWEYDFVCHLEHLSSLDIEYIPPQGKYPGQLKIQNERYFKHYGLAKWEPNLENSQYQDTLFQSFFPNVKKQAMTVLGRPLSTLQERWVNPTFFPKSNLRPVPLHAYRWDATTVKATRWVTHERLNKLIFEAIKSLFPLGIPGSSKLVGSQR